MPLADTERCVARATEDLCERPAPTVGTSPEYPGKFVGKSGSIPMPTRWWLRPVSKHARVGEQTAVVWKFVKRTPRAASVSTFGVTRSDP